MVLRIIHNHIELCSLVVEGIQSILDSNEEEKEEEELLVERLCSIQDVASFLVGEVHIHTIQSEDVALIVCVASRCEVEQERGSYGYGCTFPQA